MAKAGAKLALLGVLALQVLPCAAAWHNANQSVMGTEVSVTLWTDDTDQGQQQAEQAMAAVFAEMHRIDATYSPYKDTSELARLNRDGSKSAQTISAETWFLLKRSLHYAQITDGAFDITFASVGWFYDYRNKKQPKPSATRKLLPAINYRWLQLDEAAQTVFFQHANVRIDLGGIAKGYAVDRAIALLGHHGIRHATVSAGGDSKILGDKRGKPWLIGIKHPRLPADAPTTSVITLPLADTAVSTSGDYERFFVDEQGTRIHHIINPKTGRPAEGIMSVTVLGPHGIDTDALSTSVFVLGLTQGLALIERLAEVDGIIITTDGKTHYSSGLAPPKR